MFKQLLKTDYSVDGRWASLTGQYTRVAADVVAMDSPLPLKKRDSLEKASGELPKMGMELFLNEKQMTDIDTLHRDLMKKPSSPKSSRTLRA